MSDEKEEKLREIADKIRGIISNNTYDFSKGGTQGFKCKLENGSEIEYIPASESEIGISIFRIDTTDGLRYESPAYYPVKNHKLKILETHVLTDDEKEKLFKLKADYMGE